MRYILPLIVMLLSFLEGLAQAPSFERSFGDSTSPVANPKVIQTSDKGFAVLGFNSSNLATLTKIDATGNRQWTKLYPDNHAGGFIQTADKGFIIGFQGSYPYYNARLIKTDSLGNIQWSSVYNATSQFNTILELKDGYAVCGANYADDLMLLRMDFSGNVRWVRTAGHGPGFGHAATDMVCLKSDSCFYLVNRADVGGVNSLALLTKISKSGRGIWRKSISIDSNIYVQNDLGHLRLRESPLPGKLTVSISGAGSSWKSALLTIDTAGNVSKCMGLSNNSNPGQWYWAYDKPGTENNIITANVISGLDTSGYSYNNIMLVKYDSAGSVKWVKQIGGLKTTVPSDLICSADSGFVIAGTTNYYTQGSVSTFLVKTDYTLQNLCNIRAGSSPISEPTRAWLNPAVSYFDTIGYIMAARIFINAPNANLNFLDDCICHPPVANFAYQPGSSCMDDYSTGATKWYWDFGDGRKDSMQISPCHQFADTLYHNVCLHVENACGKDSVCHLIKYVFYPIGVKETKAASVVSLYPNPGNGVFFLNYGSSPLPFDLKVQIFDVFGRLIQNLNPGAVGNNEIDLSASPGGLYFVKMLYDGKVITSKLLLAR